MKWLNRYKGFLREIKWFYVLNNLFFRDGLRHNKKLFSKFGIKKSIYAPLSAKDFKGIAHSERSWADQSQTIDEIRKDAKFLAFSEEIQEKIISFREEGYMILEKFMDAKDVDGINEEIDALVLEGKLAFNYTKTKIMQSYKYAATVKKTFQDERLLSILKFLLGRNVIPFHTINFFTGSQQKPHSDAYHMSTFPEGFLIAVWIALEDIDMEQGPVSFYPGSHRWKQITNEDLPLDQSAWRLDGQANEKYETYLANKIAASHIQPKVFLAKKGDILIWHSNLIHGGLPMKDAEMSRKSLVMHYFAENVICYHEISQRPAIFDPILRNIYP
ncbi:MAG: phytanoyl-CoA dioxygenase family protein [Chitinophagales bacterium]|nr:phytanoyl-CoA dioxygenase family protein [Chitinophagales bacterium]